MENPYQTCPTFETENFILRLISEGDAQSLLKCYSDGKAQKFFNSDRCTGDFCMDKVEDMTSCIKAWLWAYSEQEFVRFAVVDKAVGTAVGTVEMFGNVGKSKTSTGILRVDVSSLYETTGSLNEIFGVCSANFFDLFQVETIATKAIPQATERRTTLREFGFVEGIADEGEHYFLRARLEGQHPGQ